MKDQSVEICFAAKPVDFEHVLSWTIFPSSSWAEIDKCFKNNCFLVARINGKAVGFIAYKYSTVSVFISIAETHPDFQNQGIAKLLVEGICERYADSVYKAIYLYCAPKDSQYAWEKIGFTHYPKRARQNREDVYMYRIFGDVAPVCQADGKMDGLKNVVKIYNSEIPRDDATASWYAEVEFIEGTDRFKKPFLFFGNEDWQIEIYKEGAQVIRDRYKKYDRRSAVHECMYIDELK